MILERNKLRGYKYVYNEDSICTVTPSTRTKKLNNPYVGKKITPNLILNFWEYLHKKRGFKLIGVKYAHIKNARDLLIKYGEKKVINLMIKSAEVAQHPWSFNFINKIGLQIYGI